MSCLLSNLDFVLFKARLSWFFSRQLLALRMSNMKTHPIRIAPSTLAGGGRQRKALTRLFRILLQPLSVLATMS